MSRTGVNHKPYERVGHALGGKRSPTLNTWTNMVGRCTNPNRPDYRYYGWRGVTVCDRWRESFAAFLADMGPKPDGLSLDRIDNSGGYGPENCRWATKHEQMQNTRHTRLIAFNGHTMGLNAWAAQIGITHSSLQGRLRRGWTLEKSLMTPRRRENRRPRVGATL